MKLFLFYELLRFWPFRATVVFVTFHALIINNVKHQYFYTHSVLTINSKI